MKKSVLTRLLGSALISPMLATPSFAAEAINLEEMIVKANRFDHKESETTYASEIHTAKEIEESGAATLYDFLVQRTSLNVLSSYGNKATPSVNLRGFGNESGSQNVVITLDGQRLNNIDNQPQLLGAIPLSNIERIEIIKGSGSVIYGDGATAGAIQIYTKNKTGVTISSALGSAGQQNHYINAGVSAPFFDLSANVAHDSSDGFSQADITGHQDTFRSDTQNIKLKLKPTQVFRILAEATHSQNDVRYINYMSLSQFNDNPRQDPRNIDFYGNISPYTHQRLNTDQWRIGAEYDISPQWHVQATHFREDKLSDYVNFFSKSNYDYDSNDISVRYSSDVLNVIGGFQAFDGKRSSSNNVTAKDNKAVFAQVEYRPNVLSDAITLSAGARRENVRYRYTPTTGNGLHASDNLNAWDVGVNYRFNSTLTAFANYNKAYQAPDIDRFFNYGGTFNGFIEPAQARTINLGINHTVQNNHLKVTVFRTHLDKEIYYNAATYTNTNIDQSHKYGLEIQDHFKINDHLLTTLTYNYTRAIIDKETDGGVTFDGNNLPGVPKHTVIANLNYRFFEHANLNLNHIWRSKAYAYNDFLNTAKQRQSPYQSTSLALSYQLKHLQIFTSINNLFAHKNSIQVQDDAIYPVDFERTWRFGLKADF